MSESKVPQGFYDLVGLEPWLLVAENFASRASLAPRSLLTEFKHIAVPCIQANMGDAWMFLT